MHSLVKELNLLLYFYNQLRDYFPINPNSTLLSEFISFSLIYKSFILFIFTQQLASLILFPDITIVQYFIIECLKIMRKFVCRFYFSLLKFDSKKDYYKVLSLSSNATQQQIKKSYFKLAKKYHPDVNKGNEQIFKEINEAHQVLSSQQTKKDYDQSRKESTQSYQNMHDSHRYQSKVNRQGQRTYKQPEYDFNQNPAKFRQYMRKKHQEDMKKYTQQRNNYDDLGNTYDNYDRFRQESLKNKKKQQYEQKTKVTQDSVKKQQQAYKQASDMRAEKQRQKRRQQIKNDMLFRYSRGVKNMQSTIDGIKQMGNILKDFFKKK